MRPMRARTRILVTVAAMVIVAAGCSSDGAGADKAGGSGEPVELVMANPYGGLDQLPGVAYFVDRAEEISGGEVRITVVDDYGDFESDAEQRVVRDVSSGEVDLGWVGTRVFDTMGVKSFQALTAPMLVDSYALQDAIIESGITAQMLTALDELGVTGLAVLADGLRKPVGVDEPIVGATDWADIGFGTFTSKGQEQAIRALGATPSRVIGPYREEAIGDGTIQAFEMGLFIYQHNPTLGHLAPYVAADVNLWPQMDVLIADPDRLEALTSDEREWLQQAAKEAASRSAALADTEARSIEVACDAGARFAEATDTDLAVLQQAFAPVYTHLQSAPTTKAFIEQIQALKASTPAGPAPVIPESCTGPAPEQPEPGGASGEAPAYLNGTYRYVLTKEDAQKAGEPNLDEYPSVVTTTLRDGRMEGGGPGEPGTTYTVVGDRINFYVPAWGYSLVFTFSVDNEGDLHLTPVLPMDPGDQFVWATHPWTRIG